MLVVLSWCLEMEMDRGSQMRGFYLLSKSTEFGELLDRVISESDI